MLLPREKYPSVEKECQAVKLGIQAFRVYLLGKPFIVYTDHHALIWLDRLKEANPRLTILYLVNITTDFTSSAVKLLMLLNCQRKVMTKLCPASSNVACSLMSHNTQEGGRRHRYELGALLRSIYIVLFCIT